MNALLAAEAIDIAVLDIDLGPETSNSVADTLTKHGVPFLFVTGYAGVSLSDYDDAEILGKPFTEQQLEARLCSLLNS
jgi:hypothetical protein